MKHENQEEAAKNKVAPTDQHKKADKSQQHERKDSMDSRAQGPGGSRVQGNTPGSDHANWQKEKQGNKK